MRQPIPGSGSHWKAIAAIVAFVAGIATIVALGLQLLSQGQQIEAQARQDERMAEQVAKQNTQIALQKTQIALSAEQNRIVGQQGTVTARQIEEQQARAVPVQDNGSNPTTTAIAETRRSAEATRQALDIQLQHIEATQTALAKTLPSDGVAANQASFQVQRVRVGIPPDNLRFRIAVDMQEIRPNPSTENLFSTSISNDKSERVRSALLTVLAQADGDIPLIYLDDRPDEVEAARALADISLEGNSQQLQVNIVARGPLYQCDTFFLPHKDPGQTYDIVVIDLGFSVECPKNRK